ncbi:MULTISPECIES: MgtC/SapB family protein [unclassified Burkholderia]|uniref:MgtC/SapB family protein n=1 Tax=unclassified Burkholderia TaxID=2613784 RepID=UPI000F5608CB|nr:MULTISPECIES: MgtC/SapB family protein [unclassified Burkholderia]RQR68083.1 MgtC/SapB family protein [Burkholderia sp. Bp9012]RQR70286.1 MgtC/SapB family protein [Burkholderia sp. Bp9011]RQR83033.1 MgtC/SapB family protein [Burkholderia sp. Bp9010]RQZ38745.1 MgtC/SapB family protein [Burkholderia sp. Bp9099]
MITNGELLLRLALAAILGAAVGIERERMSWAAGLRTHMLVCVGSSLIMLVSAYGFNDVAAQQHISLDPSRVAAQVVSGIGFLGAGAILLRGEVVRGLTTAASVWCVAGVGLAVGGGMYVGSIGGTVIILLILAGVKPLEKRFVVPKRFHNLDLLTVRGALSLNTLYDMPNLQSVRVKQFVSRVAEHDPTLDQVSIAFSKITDDQCDAIVRALEGFPGVCRCLRSA